MNVLPAAVLALALISGAVQAQQTQTPGAAAPPETPVQEVKPTQSAILPSAEDHKRSAAPTMQRDCTKNPADCQEPVGTVTQTPKLSTPATKP